jgi:hypothetical protein
MTPASCLHGTVVTNSILFVIKSLTIFWFIDMGAALFLAHFHQDVAVGATQI